MLHLIIPSFLIHLPSGAVIRFAHVSSLRLVDASHLYLLVRVKLMICIGYESCEVYLICVMLLVLYLVGCVHRVLISARWCVSVCSCVMSRTCIHPSVPSGVYHVLQKTSKKNFCDSIIPKIENVPAFLSV